MSQLPASDINRRAAQQFAPRQIEINPRVSTDQRFNETGEDGILAAAADNNWISSILSRQLDRAFVKTDPNFVLTKESLLKYSEGLPDEWMDEFMDAGSDEEARVIRAQLKRRMSNSRTLQESGWPGAAANLASNIVDPVAFGAGLLTGGAGWIAKGGRLVRMGKAGLVAAAGTVPITAYQESQDPDGTVENVLYNTAGAMLLGSLGHTAGELATGRWAIKTMREIEARDVALLPPGSLTKNGVDTYGPELKQNRIADAIDAETTRAVSESDTHVEDFEGLAEAARKNELQVIDLDEAYPPRTQDVEVETAGLQKINLDTGETVPPGGGGGSGGGGSAKQLPPPGGPLSTVVRRPRDYIAEPVDTKTWAAAVRPGRAGRLGTSEIPEMRMAGSVYAQDALARKGGEPAPYGADAWKHREFNAHMGEEEAATGPLLKKFLKDNNVPVTKRYQTALRFWEAVSFQMEGAPLGTIAPEIEAAALVHRKKYKDLLGVAKRHGVRGFENIPENADYFPHHWNVGETNAKVADWGKGAIEELVTKGIATAGNDPTWAAKASPGFLKGILNLGAFNDLDKARFFIGDADTLKSVFKRFATDLSDADAERIAEFLKPQDMGLHPRAKRRMGLDTTAFIERVKDGKVERLYLHQLLEMNAKAVLQKYTAQILGAAAESDILRAMSLRVHPDGSKAFKNFDELLAHIQGQYAEKNILTGRGKAKRDIERLVSLRNELVGIPNYENDGFAALSRATRAFNYIRSSGTFGIAQANEFATVLSEYGAQPILQQFGFGGLVKHLLSGKVKNELLDELRLMSGVGTEGATHNVTARFRDHATIEEFSGGGKMDELLRRGERLAGHASGIIGITRIQQEMAGLAAAQKLANIAFSKRPLSKARLADMGFSEADWNLIAPELVKNTTREGRRVVSFNLDNWDTYAAARFISGLDRWSGRSVLGTSAGSLAKWMTHPAAKLLLQFRSFPIQAWEKLFLRGIQIHDIRAFMGWALTGALGASTYAAQQYLASLTDKDRKKTLAKKLSWKNLAAQGFARSGASSLMPQFIDTGVGVFKVDNIFDSRYSGLKSSGWTSNPTSDAFNSAYTFARGLGGLVTGHNMTKAEVRAGTRLLPFNNVLGVRNALDYFADQFPKSSK